jgi:glycosyltransferase involved in cell wall biosynthesis
VRERMEGYGQAKEAIWKALHGIQGEQGTVDSLFWQDEFVDFTYYNRLCSEFVAKLDKENDFDLFYIHDFQQLPAAQMLQTLKPKIFRWHIPFDESLIPEMWRQSLASYLNAYNVIIVSCKSYLGSLKRFGYGGEAHHIYPYIDQSVYRRPTESEIEGFDHKFGMREDDRVLLVVARLDPMKGQDRAIRGFAQVVKNFPNLKLVVAGNGSFSSSEQGLGLSKAERWLSQLCELVRSLGVEDRVVFTGHLSHSELQAAYERCELTILPSVLEGFGLVVIESWLYKKPAIVSSTAGVAELVEHGENGLLFNPNDPDDLAAKISLVLSDQNLASVMGENGYATSQRCSLERGVESEAELMLSIAGLARC